MVLRFEKVGERASDAALRSLEAALTLSLPPAYRRFLAEHDGGIPEPNAFPVPGPIEQSGIDEFFGIEAVLRNKELLRGRLPTRVVPIAQADGGDLLCLKLPEGTVLYWNHEADDANEFLLLADDFTTFLTTMNPFNIDDVELKPGQVESVWIHPDLLDQVRKPPSS